MENEIIPFYGANEYCACMYNIPIGYKEKFRAQSKALITARNYNTTTNGHLLKSFNLYLVKYLVKIKKEL